MDWRELLLGLCGVVVLLWPALSAGLHLGRRELAGAGLVLLASLSWAGGSIVSKRWHLEVDTYSASGWEMLIAGIVDCLVGLLFGSFRQASWTRPAVLAIGYLIVAGSWIGFTAYVWLLRHVSSSKVATYAYVNPIVAVFLGWLVLHERITPYIVAGSVDRSGQRHSRYRSQARSALHGAGTGAGCGPGRRKRLGLTRRFPSEFLVAHICRSC